MNFFDRILLIGPLMNGKALSIPPTTQCGESVIVTYSRPPLTPLMIRSWPETLSDAAYAFRQALPDVQEGCERKEYLLVVEAPGSNWFVKQVTYMVQNEAGDGYEVIVPSKQQKPTEMIVEWEERAEQTVLGVEFSF